MRYKLMCLTGFCAMLLSIGALPASEKISLKELLKTKKPQEVITQINWQIKHHPKDPELIFLRGAIFEHFGYTKKAKEDFLFLSQKYPKNPVVMNNLGVICAKRGEHSEAKSYFKAALKLDHTYKEARNNLRGAQNRSVIGTRYKRAA